MNHNEFREWLRVHSSIHPDFAAWASSQEQATREDFAKLWFRALEPIPLDVAVAVSEGLVSGQFELMDAWRFNRQWQFVGRHVAAIARAITGSPTYRRQADQGRPESHKCHHCRDTGLRDVFSGRSVQKVIESPEMYALLASLATDPPPPIATVAIDGDTRQPDSLRRMLDEILEGARLVKNRDTPAIRAARTLRPATAVCNCIAGDDIWAVQGVRGEQDRTDSARRWTENQRYSPARHCDCPGGDTLAAAADLTDWIAERSLQPAASGHPNYSQDLAEYGEL